MIGWVVGGGQSVATHTEFTTTDTIVSLCARVKASLGGQKSHMYNSILWLSFNREQF